MKKLFILITALLIISINGCDNNSCYYWAKTYGGGSIDSARSIQQTTDGGYIVAGYTNNFVESCYENTWVIKLTKDGSVEWEKAYHEVHEPYTDYPIYDYSRAYDIKQTTDSGYILVGEAMKQRYCSPVTVIDYDVLVIKLDENGDVSWQKTFRDGCNTARSVDQTTEGGYIVAGYSYAECYEIYSPDESRIWVMKLDSDGEITWQKQYYFQGENGEAHSIKNTTDGGYIVAGQKISQTHNRDAWVLKLDVSGDVTWQKTYGGSDNESIYSIQQTEDDGFIMAGYTYSFGTGKADAWVLKLDENGEITWQKSYGDESGDYACSIQHTEDGGYIVSGQTSYFYYEYSKPDIWVLKLNREGDIEWQKKYGGITAWSIQQIEYRGYIVAGEFGTASGDFYVVKLDKRGNIPGCDIIEETSATVSDTDVIGQDTDCNFKSTSFSAYEPELTAQDTSAEVNTLCSGEKTFIRK